MLFRIGSQQFTSALTGFKVLQGRRRVVLWALPNMSANIVVRKLRPISNFPRVMRDDPSQTHTSAPPVLPRI
ncbi:hypothetical protein J1614_010246 [Plenodomus biglobosus]|nr:hypothetical protein J1614_010246 [Plenodomus biglobosus]